MGLYRGDPLLRPPFPIEAAEGDRGSTGALRECARKGRSLRGQDEDGEAGRRVGGERACVNGGLRWRTVIVPGTNMDASRGSAFMQQRAFLLSDWLRGRRPREKHSKQSETERAAMNRSREIACMCSLSKKGRVSKKGYCTVLEYCDVHVLLQYCTVLYSRRR